MLRRADTSTLPRYVADPSIWGGGTAIAEAEAEAEAAEAAGSESVASMFASGGNGGPVGTDGSVVDLKLLAREWAAGWAPQFTASAVGDNGDGMGGATGGVGGVEEAKEGEGGAGADAGQNDADANDGGGGAGGGNGAEVEDISSSHGRSFLSMFSGSGSHSHHSDDGPPGRPSLSLNRSSSHGLDASFTEANAESFGHALAKSVAVTDISKVVTAAEEAEADEEEGEADEFLIYDGAGSDDDWGMVEATAAAATGNGNGNGLTDQKKRNGEGGAAKQVPKQAQSHRGPSTPSGAGDADHDAGTADAARGAVGTSDAGAGAGGGAGIGTNGSSIGGLRGNEGGWLGLDQDPHAPLNGSSTDWTHDAAHAPRKFGIEAEAPPPRRELVATASVTMVSPLGAFKGRLVLFDRELYFLPHRPNGSSNGSSNGPSSGAAEGAAGGGSVSGSQSWQDVDPDGSGGGGSGAGEAGSDGEGSGADTADRRPAARQEKWMVRKLQGAYLRRYRLRDTAVEIFSESTGAG